MPTHDQRTSTSTTTRQTTTPQNPAQTPQTPTQDPSTTVDPAASYDTQRDALRPGDQGERYAQQREAFAPGKPRKGVSGKAMKRLVAAKAAIKHAKSVFEFGAGNQKLALDATNFNSAYRLMVMRDLKYWDLDWSVRALASANPTALTAAMAEIAHGGNCGEHATVGFDYLRVNAPGEKLTKASVKGLDHAFVLVGDLDNEGDEELVVCDPWPTAATACTWEDHFAEGYKGTGRADINRHDEMIADGKNVKAVIKRGLKLNAWGKHLVEMELSEEESKEKMEEGTSGDSPWIWQHPDATKRHRKYDYYAKPETTDSDRSSTDTDDE